MRKRLSAVAMVGSVGAALAAAACGLGFSDIEVGSGTSPTGTANPTGTPTGTANPTGTPTGTGTSTPTPEGGVDAGGDAGDLDAGANLDAADARPVVTAAKPAFAFRFELNGICGLFPTVYCTRNDGTFGRNGLYRGASAEIGTGPLGTGVNFWRAKMSGTSYVEADDVSDAVPATNATKLTVAAWVRRTNDPRRDVRVVSLAPKTGAGGGGNAVFELGFRSESDTKLLFSVDEDLEAGEATANPIDFPADKWVFIAATYDKDAAMRVCFYSAVDGNAAALVECRAYKSKDAKRVANARLAIGGPANDRNRNATRSFSGFVDNAFVYIGDVLPVDQIEALRTD